MVFSENLAEWPVAAMRYAWLALQAQAKCRASLELVARLDRAAHGPVAAIAPEPKNEDPPNDPMQPETGADQGAAKGSPQRCRMHGGKGSGAPEGNRSAWKHGARSA